VLIRL